MEPLLPTDENISTDGRVMEVLSEHMCQGWLEGYLLTGRHGFFSCYEAFIHIVDSMFNQHAKWLKVTREIPWRRPIASLNYLLTSHVWRQDHNGFTHQDPGFIDLVVNKKADVVRVYLAARREHAAFRRGSLLAQPPLRERDRGGKAARSAVSQHEGRDRALHRGNRDLGLGQQGRRAVEPDVVMACAGDIPTLETLAAVDLLRQHFPDIKIRVVNVVDLMTLQPPSEHPHGISDHEFDSMFTTDKPIIFAYHGYPDADSPADLPPQQPRQSARARIQRRRNDHDAVRYDGAERSRSFSSRQRCGGSCAAAAAASARISTNLCATS